jgi:hypothetical protein
VQGRGRRQLRDRQLQGDLRLSGCKPSACLARRAAQPRSRRGGAARAALPRCSIRR